jgi:Zn-dependent M28 family amino/carboxypeptidase
MSARERSRFLRRASLLAHALVSPPRALERRVAAFDGAAALAHLERLVAIGARPAGSSSSERARAYIEEQLRTLPAETRVQRFAAATPIGSISMANIMAVLPGRRPDVIVLGGHYDTAAVVGPSFVGANDGGSSAALLLQLAQELAPAAHEFTYWVTFFDGEEAVMEWAPGDSLYGSRHLARELKRNGTLPSALILVDMIGDRDLTVQKDRYSTPWLTEIIWTTARRLGYAHHFRNTTIRVEDDHLPFVQVGVPAVLLIDFGYPAWHTVHDTLGNMSAASLGVVGDVIRAALPAVEHELVARCLTLERPSAADLE